MKKCCSIFFVFRSWEYLFARIAIPIAPIILFFLLKDENHFWEPLLIASVGLVLMLNAEAILSPIIVVHEQGLYCVQWLKKRYFMAWEDIILTGAFQQSVGKVYSSSRTRFIFFASSPLKQKVYGREFFAPQLTPDFFFVADSRRLRKALKLYLSDHDYCQLPD